MAKEMRKNTLWNRISHTKEVNANVELKKKLSKLIESAPTFIARIGDVTYEKKDKNSAKVTGAKTLMEILNLHKELWATEFQNVNLGPDSCGMFRTKSIPTMKAEEVFLGDIWGLFTKNIPFWDKYQGEGKRGGGYPIYEYLTVYQIILGQYKRLLSSNVQAIAKDAKEKLKELEQLGY